MRGVRSPKRGDRLTWRGHGAGGVDRKPARLPSIVIEIRAHHLAIFACNKQIEVIGAVPYGSDALTGRCQCTCSDREPGDPPTIAFEIGAHNATVFPHGEKIKVSRGGPPD